MLEEDYDPYAYFEDLEYLSDAYFDSEEASTSGPKKRKKGAHADHGSATKRNKTRGTLVKTHTNTMDGLRDSKFLIWRTQSYQDRELAPVTPPTTVPKPEFALLRDWKRLVTRGSAPFPGSDHRSSSTRATEAGDDWQDKENPVQKRNSTTSEADEGLDLSNLGVIANLLQGDQLEGLRRQLETRGLDSSALEEVLRDMVEGREPDFEEDDGDDDGDGVGYGHHHEDEEEEIPPARNVVQSKDRKRKLPPDSFDPDQDSPTPPNKAASKEGKKLKVDPKPSVSAGAGATKIAETLPAETSGATRGSKRARPDDAPSKSSPGGPAKRQKPSTKGAESETPPEDKPSGSRGTRARRSRAK